MGLDRKNSSESIDEKGYQRFSSSQKEILLSVFEEDPYPAFETKCRLAGELDRTYTSVNVWFENERKKRRRLGLSLPSGINQSFSTRKQAASSASHHPINEDIPIPPPLPCPVKQFTHLSSTTTTSTQTEASLMEEVKNSKDAATQTSKNYESLSSSSSFFNSSSSSPSSTRSNEGPTQNLLNPLPSATQSSIRAQWYERSEIDRAMLNAISQYSRHWPR